MHQQPFVKKGAITVIGWSWGGASALQALGRTESREPVHVDAVVAYYPACAYTQKWNSEIPVLILAAANDDIAPVRHCEELFDTLPKRHRVTVRVYDNAHHCFDNVTLPAEMQCMFGTIGYNEAATKAAWNEVTNFLRK